MSKYAELLERVKDASGPARLIDQRLHFLFVPERRSDGTQWQWVSQKPSDTRPGYTASIDAAVALVERMMPGAVWHVMTDYGNLNRANIGPAGRPSASVYRVEDRPEFAQADAATPPLALLAALLTALEAADLSRESATKRNEAKK